jgi:hypothetical protein
LLKEYLKGKSENLSPQVLEEYNEELERADAEIENGDFILHEDVIKCFSMK